MIIHADFERIDYIETCDDYSYTVMGTILQNKVYVFKYSNNEFSFHQTLDSALTVVRPSISSDGEHIVFGDKVNYTNLVQIYKHNPDNLKFEYFYTFKNPHEVNYASFSPTKDLLAVTASTMIITHENPLVDLENSKVRSMEDGSGIYHRFSKNSLFFYVAGYAESSVYIYHRDCGEKNPITNLSYIHDYESGACVCNSSNNEVSGPNGCEYCVLDRCTKCSTPTICETCEATYSPSNTG